jgi:hypothetical protein
MLDPESILASQAESQPGEVLIVKPPEDEKWSVGTTYFFGFAVFGFCCRSFRSLLRPKARLFVTRSSSEMKCTGTPKNVLATLFVHASGKSTPVISDRMSMLRAGSRWRCEIPTGQRSLSAVTRGIIALCGVWRPRSHGPYRSSWFVKQQQDKIGALA